jgi:hypothetical protein
LEGQESLVRTRTSAVTVLEQDETEVSAAIDGVNASLWTPTRFDALLCAKSTTDLAYNMKVMGIDRRHRGPARCSACRFRDETCQTRPPQLALWQGGPHGLRRVFATPSEGHAQGPGDGGHLSVVSEAIAWVIPLHNTHCTADGDHSSPSQIVGLCRQRI